MRKVKLNEILEECLAAVIDGRRSVDDCLSLYPQLAPELEPLLTTALQVTDVFQAESPSWHIQERTRLRVLAAQQARIRSRNLVSGVDLTRSAPWATRHWGLLGAAAAAVVAAVFVGSLMLFSPGGDSGPGGTSSDAVVVSFGQSVEDAQSAWAENGAIETDQLAELLKYARELAATYDAEAIEALDPVTKQQIQENIQAVNELLESIAPVDPDPETENLVRDLMDQGSDLANEWGIAAPTPTPALTPTPAPSGEPTPTAPPTGEPTPTPAPTPAPTPTTAPTPTPAPTNIENDEGPTDAIRPPDA
jgi:hypothetical protein